MVKKIDSSDQVEFLVACIKHTNNGKPDFGAVALELNIVTKAAAQKRYERMLKAHQSGKEAASKAEEDAPDQEDAPPTSPVKRRKTSAPRVSRKKIKQDEGQEEPGPRKAKARIRAKKEPEANNGVSGETSESGKSLDGEV
ncbi:hypothetical protein CDD82_324 [Ophiocordyceps australis]|uniref:Myb-like DNA-binding domain-containing protein n=1 Tax=Ophiocordyceps australis TaxID=1399860 RepID=A0A2C5ZQN6_9HYPO|nr:hypothetical protein CDD82_324 [Ophiocordyceps australis]